MSDRCPLGYLFHEYSAYFDGDFGVFDESGTYNFVPNKRPPFLGHLSRRLVGELIVYPWSGVRPMSSSSSTISNMNISATSGPFATKFYLKHHWVGGKAA